MGLVAVGTFPDLLAALGDEGGLVFGAGLAVAALRLRRTA